MIRLEVKDYCSDCCDFEADVTPPERIAFYSTLATPDTVRQSDTIVRCRYAKRCEAIKRYLTQQAERDSMVQRLGKVDNCGGETR